MARSPDPALGLERRRQILEAAQVCFERRGFHAASISEICGEARISPGHLYHFFENKEAIVEAIVAQDQAAEADFFARVMGHERPVEALFRIGAHERPQRAISEPVAAEIMAEAARNDRIGRMVRANDQRTRHLLADVLRAGQASGEVHPGHDLEAMVTLLLALGDGYLIRAIAQPGFETDALRDLVHAIFLRAMAGPPASVPYQPD
ncbi:TetR/AcrR family transcriptional regulator [Zavarzinia sp. CC-PAN008]|uniref:TetR/AcrR family transcriptional regulator n=1 Tax=Zavarzinia sp. CC-PAN008 TaxID=3243332 RepID=UPI003F74ACE5